MIDDVNAAGILDTYNTNTNTNNAITRYSPAFRRTLVMTKLKRSIIRFIYNGLT